MGQLWCSVRGMRSSAMLPGGGPEVPDRCSRCAFHSDLIRYFLCVHKAVTFLQTRFQGSSPASPPALPPFPTTKPFPRCLMHADEL